MVLAIMTKRLTLIPPPVLPAQAPINISITMIILHVVFHVSKSTVANPVVVIIEATVKDVCLMASPTESNICLTLMNMMTIEDNMTLQINIAGNNEICDKKVFYRISVYADHRIIKCFNEKPYADVGVERNKLSCLKLNIKASDLVDKNHIYLIAVPVKWNNYDKGILSIIKTETKPIK